MLTAAILLIAIWLVAAPSVLTFSTAATWTSIIAGVTVASARLMPGSAEVRSGVIAAVGVYLMFAGFFFRGEAFWCTGLAGIGLVVTGFMMEENHRRPVPRPRPT